jgi:hypothetical protein
MAGAIWPMVLLGVAEIGAEIACAKAFGGQR